MYSGYAGPDSEPKNLKPLYILAGVTVAAFITVGWYVLREPDSEWEDICRDIAKTEPFAPVVATSGRLGKAEHAQLVAESYARCIKAARRGPREWPP